MSLAPEQLIFLSLSIALLPAAIGVLTTYLKVSIILGMLRSALGTQQTPSGLVVMAVSIAFTWVIMSPVFVETSSRFISNQARLSKGITKESKEAFEFVVSPWKEFISAHAGKRESELIVEIGSNKDPQSWGVIVPAFILSELKEAFAMALMVLLPFAVIDIVVANILGGLGMFMVSPTLISLPLKLGVFVMSDAWIFLAKSIVASYGGVDV